VYIFKSLRDPENRYDISDIEMTVNSRGLSLTDLLTEFFKFVNACGYVVKDGTSIDISDGGECSIHHPEEEPKECKCSGKDCCSKDDDDEHNKFFDPHNPLTGKPYPNQVAITKTPLEDYATKGLMYPPDQSLHNIPHSTVLGSLQPGTGSITTHGTIYSSHGYVQSPDYGWLKTPSVTSVASTYPAGTTTSHTMSYTNTIPTVDTSTSGSIKGYGLSACVDCYHECDDCYIPSVIQDACDNCSKDCLTCTVTSDTFHNRKDSNNE